MAHDGTPWFPDAVVFLVLLFYSFSLPHLHRLLESPLTLGAFFHPAASLRKALKNPKLSQTLNPRPIVIVEVLDSPTLPKLESSSVEALRVPGGWYLAQRSLAPCVGLLCPSEAQVRRRGTSEQES